VKGWGQNQSVRVEWGERGEKREGGPPDSWGIGTTCSLCSNYKIKGTGAGGAGRKRNRAGGAMKAVVFGLLMTGGS